MERTSFKKIAVIILAVVVCLFALLLILCRKYALQNQELQAENEELSAMLDNRDNNDKTFEAGAEYMEQLSAQQQAETDRLQAQLAEAVSMKEYRIETGFVKKGGVYLIDTESQLLKLRQLIMEDEEIEPGVPAAEASYRLRASLEMGGIWGDWFSIGTEETPFSGSFDGDGHSISGKFPFMEGEDVPEAVFCINEAARIENLQIHNRMYESSDTKISVVVNDGGECAELESNLAAFPDCPVRVVMYAWDSDAGKTADALRERWERNCGQDGYSVSMSFYPIYGEKADEDAYLQNILAPFYMLAGNDYKEIIEEALEQEEGYLRFVRLERIGELICCSFETGEMEESYHREGEGYHIILEGEWEGIEVPGQHLFVPYTMAEQRSVGTYQDYMLEKVDFNFDGKLDLLIHEGSSGGSGGSWSNYRAIIWNEKSKQFEYYPSFPEQASELEFDRQRVIFRGNGGISYEHVAVYGVVDGEYVCTRELVCNRSYSEEKQESIEELSYYEMGELVQTHILSDGEEKKRLYPDMDYWRN